MVNRQRSAQEDTTKKQFLPPPDLRSILCYSPTHRPFYNPVMKTCTGIIRWPTGRVAGYCRRSGLRQNKPADKMPTSRRCTVGKFREQDERCTGGLMAGRGLSSKTTWICSTHVCRFRYTVSRKQQIKSCPIFVLIHAHFAIFFPLVRKHCRFSVFTSHWFSTSG